MAIKKAATKLTRSAEAFVHPRIAFMRSIRLAGLGLDTVSASVERNRLADVSARGAELSVEVSITHQVVELQDKSFVIGATVILTQKEEGTESSLVDIKAAFSAKFDTTQKAAFDEVEHFAQLEGRLVFFPYIRQLISDLTYRLSIQTIVLPLSSELENKS